MAETAKKTKKVSKNNTEKKIVKNTKSELKSGAFAVIETGGKQYRVSEGDTIKIEKIKSDTKKEFKIGDMVTFSKVLLYDNGKDLTEVGTPYLEGAKVVGILEEMGRNPKVTVIKYKQKSRYFKKNGHRQPFFKVKIDKIA